MRKAIAGYIGVAIAFFWPLPLYLTTRFTGPVSEDTGVYVWNLWHFRHQLLHGRPPFFTDVVLSLTQPTDLSLHNYTTFANIVAFPLIPFVGLTAAFNVICIGLTILTAVCTFVLARRVIGRWPEAWLAGAAFAFSPVLIARTTGHFSLVAAAPLPLFLCCLLNAGRTGKLRWGWAAGGTMAWAVTCDPYYGIYCLLLGACFVGVELVRVKSTRTGPGRTLAVARIVDLMAVCVAGFSAFIIVTGGARLMLFGRMISMRSLYTPVLALVVLLVLRSWLALRPRATLTHRLHPLCVGKFALAIAVASAVLLSPILHALSYRIADEGTLHKPIYWRSSPPGVDLLALFMPNPNHPLFGLASQQWLSRETGGALENTAALTLVGMFIVIAALWRYRFRPPALWAVLALLFGALALGPFVHVGGVNTYIPGPWAFLRYVPLISAVRAPTRFAIPAMLGFAIVFGLALRCIADRHPSRRRVILGVAAAALLFELAPAPRQLYSAEIPAIYRIIASDPANVRVLQLPFGFRDGESSLGNFNPASQYYQTFHQKRLLGAYLSRISSNEIKRQWRASFTIRALITLSEGKSLSPELLRVYKARGRRFIQRSKVGYVVFGDRTSADLRAFAMDAFGLIKIAESDGLELYRPDPSYMRRPLSLVDLDLTFRDEFLRR